MKSIFTALLSFLYLALPCHATEISEGNIELWLKPGESEVRFNVIYTDGDYVEIAAEKVGSDIFYAQVKNQYGGFECEIISEEYIKFNSDQKEHFITKVSWAPGSDSSGCQVAIRSSQGKEWLVNLFMSY